MIKFFDKKAGAIQRSLTKELEDELNFDFGIKHIAAWSKPKELDDDMMFKMDIEEKKEKPVNLNKLTRTKTFRG